MILRKYIFTAGYKAEKDEGAKESVGLVVEETVQTSHELVERLSWWKHDRYFWMFGGFFSPNLTSPAIRLCERQLLEAIIFQWSCNMVQVRDRWIAEDPPETRRSQSQPQLPSQEWKIVQLGPSIFKGSWLFLWLLHLPMRERPLSSSKVTCRYIQSHRWVFYHRRQRTSFMSPKTYLGPQAAVSSIRRKHLPGHFRYLPRTNGSPYTVPSWLPGAIVRIQ